MGRRTASTSYITPYNTAGTEQVQSAVEFGHGSFTLVNGTDYFYPLGGQDSAFISAHVQWDASVVITSITVEDCDFPERDVAWYSDNSGEWIDEDPSTAFVGSDGAGVTVTNGVVAVAGGAQGGCLFHIADSGARRTRIKISVGATGGEVRVASWAKES